MLTSVKIHRFRSCVDLDLEEIGNVLVLIGRNGAGKTNIMTAIEWAARQAINATSHEDSASESNGEVTLYFSLGGVDYSYYVKRESFFDFGPDKELDSRIDFVETLSIKTDLEWSSIFVRNGEVVAINQSIELQQPISQLNISTSSSAISAIDAILADDSKFRLSMTELKEFFSSIRYYPLPVSTSDKFSTLVIQAKEYKKWVAQKFSGPTEIDHTLLKILHLYLQNKDKYDELKSLIGEDGLGIISDITIFAYAPPHDDNNGIHLVHFAPFSNNNEQHFSFSELSFGTKRMLTLVVSILFDSSLVALIEQPEDGIHPRLVDKLTDILKSYSAGSQFILASHSVSVLNKTEPKSIRIVEIEEGTTELRSLNDCELSAAQYYLENDGSFADFLDSI